MDETLKYLLEYGSYPLIFGGLLLGGFWVPIPEDIYILASGALVGRGALMWWAAFAACFWGVFFGDLILFATARGIGHLTYDRPWFARVMPPERRARVEAMIQRNGALVVMGARFIPGLRSPIFALAAINGIGLRRFIFFDTIALCISCPLYFSLGYFFSSSVEAIQKTIAGMTTATLIVVGALIVAMVVVLLVRRMRRSKQHTAQDVPATPAELDTSATRHPGD